MRGKEKGTREKKRKKEVSRAAVGPYVKPILSIKARSGKGKKFQKEKGGQRGNFF